MLQVYKRFITELETGQDLRYHIKPTVAGNWVNAQTKHNENQLNHLYKYVKKVITYECKNNKINNNIT